MDIIMENIEKSPCLMGISTINGPFSIAMHQITRLGSDPSAGASMENKTDVECKNVAPRRGHVVCVTACGQPNDARWTGGRSFGPGRSGWQWHRVWVNYNDLTVLPKPRTLLYLKELISVYGRTSQVSELFQIAQIYQPLTIIINYPLLTIVNHYVNHC